MQPEPSAFDDTLAGPAMRGEANLRKIASAAHGFLIRPVGSALGPLEKGEPRTDLWLGAPASSHLGWVLL